MAIAYFHEFPGGTHDQAQQLSDRLEQQGDMPPAGGLFHAEGSMDGGWWAFDVWESEQSARDFYDGRLTPILSEMGRLRQATGSSMSTGIAWRPRARRDSTGRYSRHTGRPPGRSLCAVLTDL